MSGLQSQQYRRRDVTLTTWQLQSINVGTNFADKRHSVGIVCSRTQATEYSSSSRKDSKER
jgi:hypothetical protein